MNGYRRQDQNLYLCGGKDALLNKEGVIANENVRQV